MGRTARSIRFIADSRGRKITFRKRHGGILKKIHELSVLCNMEVFFYVVDPTDRRVRMFSSSDREFIPNYSTIREEDRKGPRDMQHHYMKRAALAKHTPTFPEERELPLQPRTQYNHILPKLSECDRILEQLSRALQSRI